MKNDPRIYCLHIRDSIESIERYTTGGKDAFMKSEKTQDAVLFNLAIIGEAVKKIPKTIRSRYDWMPWKKIAGTRDVVIHEYDSTSLRKIWNIVEKDVPLLKDTILIMLKEL